MTEKQHEQIIQDFITIIASYEGFTLEEELAKSLDDPDIVRWRSLAESLVDVVVETLRLDVQES